MGKTITLNKKHHTNAEGVFFKKVVDANNHEKVKDKIFLIRYRDHYSDKQLTIGRYNAGIRVDYCK